VNKINVCYCYTEEQTEIAKDLQKWAIENQFPVRIYFDNREWRTWRTMFQYYTPGESIDEEGYCPDIYAHVAYECDTPEELTDEIRRYFTNFPTRDAAVAAYNEAQRLRKEKLYPKPKEDTDSGDGIAAFMLFFVFIIMPVIGYLIHINN